MDNECRHREWVPTCQIIEHLLKSLPLQTYGGGGRSLRLYDSYPHRTRSVKFIHRSQLLRKGSLIKLTKPHPGTSIYKNKIKVTTNVTTVLIFETNTCSMFKELCPTLCTIIERGFVPEEEGIYKVSVM